MILRQGQTTNCFSVTPNKGCERATWYIISDAQPAFPFPGYLVMSTSRAILRNTTLYTRTLRTTEGTSLLYSIPATTPEHVLHRLLPEPVALPLERIDRARATCRQPPHGEGRTFYQLSELPGNACEGFPLPPFSFNSSSSGFSFSSSSRPNSRAGLGIGRLNHTRVKLNVASGSMGSKKSFLDKNDIYPPLRRRVSFSGLGSVGRSDHRLVVWRFDPPLVQRSEVPTTKCLSGVPPQSSVDRQESGRSRQKTRRKGGRAEKHGVRRVAINKKQETTKIQTVQYTETKVRFTPNKGTGRVRKGADRVFGKEQAMAKSNRPIRKGTDQY